MTIPKRCSIFSLPTLKSCCKCSLSCQRFSLSLSRLLKSSHWEWRAESFFFSQTVVKCGAWSDEVQLYFWGRKASPPLGFDRRPLAQAKWVIVSRWAEPNQTPPGRLRPANVPAALRWSERTDFWSGLWRESRVSPLGGAGTPAERPGPRSVVRRVPSRALERGLGGLCLTWSGACNNFHMTKDILLTLNRILDCTFGVIHALAVLESMYLVSVL